MWATAVKQHSRGEWSEFKNIGFIEKSEKVRDSYSKPNEWNCWLREIKLTIEE